MATESVKHELRDLLRRLAEELDVPHGKYREAQERYDKVADWLNGPESQVAAYNPVIYPQGSFALGTAIRPLGDEEYDVDAVCQLNGALPHLVSQKQIKELVGDRLKEHPVYRRMIDPPDGSRRCWTLQYAETTKFHLDVLPAIPDPDHSLRGKLPPHLLASAIYVTDTTTWNGPVPWPAQNRSNPKGYAQWFKERMQVEFERRRQVILAERRAFNKLGGGQVEDVPDHEVRTPLQRVIQLLKRHRDKRYNGDEDKPISIIITTLAAKAYNNEADLLEALFNILPRMRAGIEERSGRHWVANPVNPDENFADKWAESPRKAKLFFEWLHAVEHEHQRLLTLEGFRSASEYLREAYGDRDAAQALVKFAKNKPTSMAVALNESTLSPLFRVAHRAKPTWPVVPQFRVAIQGAYETNGSWTTFESDSRPLTKGLNLRFAVTNVFPDDDFKVYWQVVNTGPHAARDNDLRGDIRASALYGPDGLTHFEGTRYAGRHWILCYIVKDGVCIARSPEFVVNIV